MALVAAETGGSGKITYNPVKFKEWANGVISIVEQSINECSKSFNAQMEALVQPGVWSGAAAKENFQRFKDIQDALVKLTNEFGKKFGEAMNSVNETVKDLEVTNLGVNTNATQFGKLNFSDIEEAAKQNVETEEVVYSYTKMDSIADELQKINNKLSATVEDLVKEVSKLTTTGAMTGASAEELVKSLKSCVTENYEPVGEMFNARIKDIKQASDNARNVDMTA